MLFGVTATLAFAMEIAMLIGVGCGAFVWMNGGMKGATLALVVVLLVIAIWGIWAAPTSTRRLGAPLLAGLKIALFGVAIYAWFIGGPAWVWPVFAAAAALSLVLEFTVAQ